MSVYDVDIDVVSDQNVPVRLRQQIMKSWLRLLVSPVVYLQGLYNANRANDLYVLRHTSQVCYIQAALNDVFDNALRRIYIADGPYADPCYLYRVDEEKPLFIDLVSEEGTSVIPSPDPVPLFTGAETYLMGVQFIVMVPSAVSMAVGYDVNRLKAIVDKYRLVSKSNYTVQIF